MAADLYWLIILTVRCYEYSKELLSVIPPTHPWTSLNFSFTSEIICIFDLQTSSSTIDCSFCISCCYERTRVARRSSRLFHNNALTWFPIYIDNQPTALPRCLQVDQQQPRECKGTRMRTRINFPVDSHPILEFIVDALFQFHSLSAGIVVVWVCWPGHLFSLLSTTHWLCIAKKFTRTETGAAKMERKKEGWPEGRSLVVVTETWTCSSLSLIKRNIMFTH